MNPCAVSRWNKNKKTVVELRRNKDAEVKAGVKNIQFLSPRIRWLRRKDE